MQYFKTDRVLRLSGRLGLSDAQAKLRAGRLTPAKDDNDKIVKGVYDVPEPVDFKAGELVGFDDGTLPKGLYRAMAGGADGDAPTEFTAEGEPIEKTEKSKKGARPAGKKVGADGDAPTE
jgi:hypothetical protein